MPDRETQKQWEKRQEREARRSGCYNLISIIVLVTTVAILVAFTLMTTTNTVDNTPGAVW